MTGCDTTSSFSGIGKKTAWTIFQKHPELLNDVGTTVMDSKTKDNLETFVCQMYGYSEVARVNEVRRLMFLQAKKAPDDLHHFQRVNHQVTLWLQAMIPRSTVPDPSALGGWRKDESKKCLVPILISKEPVPSICLDLVVCL